MKAVVQERYGSPDLLELRDVPAPVAGPGDVLVRVRASSVHPDVWHAIRGIPYVLRLMGSGVRRPKHRIPGSDVAGVVEAVGQGETRFHPGDEVFGETIGANLWRNGGAFAELVAVPEGSLEPKPPNVTFELAAAAANAGKIAIQGLRDEGRLQAGQRVAIVGAGGGVGTIAVQVAKAWGAEVTGVDAGGKLDAIRSLGADRVIDHTREDFAKEPGRYDLVLDIAGARRFSEVRRALAADGTYVLIGHDQYGREGRRWVGSLGKFASLLVRSPFVRQLPGLRGAHDPGDRLKVVRELMEAGSVRPVVDRTFGMSEVSAAIRYLEQGGAIGRVVLTI
jgi:NADPH:quinone reductase-like Zn-dependent oxidoreductase